MEVFHKKSAYEEKLDELFRKNPETIVTNIRSFLIDSINNPDKYKRYYDDFETIHQTISIENGGLKCTPSQLKHLANRIVCDRINKKSSSTDIDKAEILYKHLCNYKETNKHTFKEQHEFFIRLSQLRKEKIFPSLIETNQDPAQRFKWLSRILNENKQGKEYPGKILIIILGLKIELLTNKKNNLLEIPDDTIDLLNEKKSSTSRFIVSANIFLGFLIFFLVYYIINTNKNSNSHLPKINKIDSKDLFQPRIDFTQTELEDSLTLGILDISQNQIIILGNDTIPYRALWVEFLLVNGFNRYLYPDKLQIISKSMATISDFEIKPSDGAILSSPNISVKITDEVLDKEWIIVNQPNFNIKPYSGYKILVLLEPKSSTPGLLYSLEIKLFLRDQNGNEYKLENSELELVSSL